MKKITNINVKIGLAIASFIAAIAFGLLGILLPPLGYIDGSVLILIAQLLVLCATLIGIQLKIDLARKYFSTEQIEERLDEDEKDIVKIQKALEQDEIRRKEDY